MNPIRFVKIFSILIFSFLVSFYTFIFFEPIDDILLYKKYRLFIYNNDLKNLQKIIDKTEAHGVIVYDSKNDKILGQKNINHTYSLASITKIIIAFLAYDKDKAKLSDIRYMLKTSDNIKAKEVGKVFADTEYDQVNYVNKNIAKYDLYVRNMSGLDVIDKDNNRYAGGEGKMLNVIHFIRDHYRVYPEVFDQTILDAKDNTNIIVDDLNFLSGGKTGYTYLSGGNLFVIIQKGLNRDIFILVLNSTEKKRFVDVQNIVDFLVKSSI